MVVPGRAAMTVTPFKPGPVVRVLVTVTVTPAVTTFKSEEYQGTILSLSFIEDLRLGTCIGS